MSAVPGGQAVCNRCGLRAAHEEAARTLLLQAVCEAPEGEWLGVFWGGGEGLSRRSGLRLIDCAPAVQIFTHERKWYSRKDLARHRIHGDPDDTSHRGHPLCKFCDERYLDNDELLKHLRRDHYFCHFCDSDGAQEYYRCVGHGGA